MLGRLRVGTEDLEDLPVEVVPDLLSPLGDDALTRKDYDEVLALMDVIGRDDACDDRQCLAQPRRIAQHHAFAVSLAAVQKVADELNV